MSKVPVPLCERRSDIPASLSKAVARALEKEPAKRFANVGEFQSALAVDSSAELSQTSAMNPVASWQRASTDELNRPTIRLRSRANSSFGTLLPSSAPIAKVVVTRLAKQTTDIDQLYAMAAKQVESEPDQQRFLRTRPR